MSLEPQLLYLTQVIVYQMRIETRNQLSMFNMQKRDLDCYICIGMIIFVELNTDNYV